MVLSACENAYRTTTVGHFYSCAASEDREFFYIRYRRIPYPDHQLLHRHRTSFSLTPNSSVYDDLCVGPLLDALEET